MRVEELILNLCGISIREHANDLGLEVECLDREVIIENTFEEEQLTIEDIRFDSEENKIIIEVE